MKYARKSKKNIKHSKVNVYHRKRYHTKSSYSKLKRSNLDISSLITTSIKKQFSKLKCTYSEQMVGDGVNSCMQSSTLMNSLYACDVASAFVTPANVRGLTILSTLFNDYLVHSSKIFIRISQINGTISNFDRNVRFYLVPYRSILPATSLESTIADMPQCKRFDFQFNQTKPLHIKYSQACHKVVGIDKNQYRSCVLTDTPTFLFGPSGAINSTTPSANGNIYWNLLCYDCTNTAFLNANQYFQFNYCVEYYAELVNRPQLTQT